MGTRNLTAVMIDGQYKIAQYGQWDGYPSGQGLTALRFLRNEMDRPRFMAMCREARWITQEETDKINADPEWKTNHPHLSRDAGAKILAVVQQHPAGIALGNSVDFAGDSLFCEWAYVIDLDKNTFEAFKGFNTEPIDPSERFASAPLDKDGNGKYYQVKHLRTWPLDALPTEEEFLKELEPDDEE